MSRLLTRLGTAEGGNRKSVARRKESYNEHNGLTINDGTVDTIRPQLSDENLKDPYFPLFGPT